MNSCEICFCDGQGLQIQCSTCGVKAHIECVGSTDSASWKCDSCKYKDDQNGLKRCAICERFGDNRLYFRVNEKVWFHGGCMKSLFTYIQSQSIQYNSGIPSIKQIEDNSTVKIPSISFVNMAAQFISEQKPNPNQYLLLMKSFLQSLLPSPSYSLRVTTESKCFQCHQYGGFMVRCSYSGCAYMFHPLCYKDSMISTQTLSSMIESNSIVCKLHRNRKKGDVVQQPRVSKLVIQKPSFQKTTKPVRPQSIKVETKPEPVEMVEKVQQPQIVEKVQQPQINVKEEMSIQQSQPNVKSEPDIQTEPVGTPNSLSCIVDRGGCLSCDGKEDEDAADDGEICDICHYGYSEPGDMLVFCEKCNLPVHQSCYGIERVPEGEWVCAVCSKGLAPAYVTCAVCQKSGGAMHRTVDNKWVHLICVFYTPELTLNLTGPEVLVEGLYQISRERAALCCSICKQCGGGCIQCSNRKCATAYHPYCALKAGYILTSKEVGSVFEYVSYCKIHTEQKQGKPKSVESTPTKRRKRGQASKKKKQKKEEIQSIPTMIVQKITAPAGESQLCSSDFWNLIEYYYVMKPNCNLILSQLRFYPHLVQSLPSLPSTSQMLSPEYLSYSKSVLNNQLLEFSDDAKIVYLSPDFSFGIPALSHSTMQQSKTQAASEDIKRVHSSTPHNVSNSSLHRPQQAFQGFDINDFADLRESYECFLNNSFIQWAQKNNVCASTSFRQARKEDVNWLLKINTINPTFSHESDYSGTFYEKNEFVIIAERVNAAGRRIPVGMVHYYLMWYYPCTGKAREAVRAVYVCTLQKVSRETHKEFVDWYQIEAEPLTGLMLLSLAFLHGRDCQVTMGCCDSTDNSVSFYTNQFGMTALPRGEGRHYTPMQLDLTTFNAFNTLICHIGSPYKGTLLCSIEMPSQSSFSIPEPVSSSLHLQFNQDRLLSSAACDHVIEKDVEQFIATEHPQWIAPTSQPPNTLLTELDRSCHIINSSSGVYIHNNAPHFYEIEPSKAKPSSSLTINHSVFKSGTKEDVRITDGKDVERELEACQEKLYSVMMSNEKAICGLIEIIESKEKETEELVSLKEKCQQCHDELYEYTREKRPDYIKAIEEDDYNDSICEVCGDGDSNTGNVILFCDGCNAAVHQDCYDLTELPNGDWFCNVCEDILVNQLGVRDVLHITPKDANETASEGGNETEFENEVVSCPILDKLHELRSQVYCCICGYSKGAMMPTMNKGQYAHVCCALWHPNCSIVNNHPLCSQPVMVPVLTKPDAMEIEPEPLQSQPSEDVVLIPLNPAQTPQPEPTSVPQPEPTPIPQPEPTPIPQPPVPALPVETPQLEEYISPYSHLRSHPDKNRYLIDISDLGNQRRSLMCQLCKKRGGVIPCSCSVCPRGVHATCAIKYELEMYWNNKPDKSHVPVEEVLVEKDYYIHCFLHSGGNQNCEIPRKMIEEYKPPLFCEVTSTKKKQNDEYVVPQVVKRKSRRSYTSSQQDQGLQRMRMKRQRRKQREENHIKKQRTQSKQSQLTFTSKPRSLMEKKIRRVLEWMKESKSSMYLFDNENNILLKLQRQIDSNELPRFGNWTGYSIENATIESLYRKYKKRKSINSIILNIREMYLSLLSYTYPSLNILDQAVAKAVAEDAHELTKLMYRLDNPMRYNQIVNNQVTTYCVCMVADGESDEFMVGCDQCGLWFHPFCIGYSMSKFYGFLSTYSQRYVDVREETGCFFCPNCYCGENVEKMKLLTEEEVIAMGGKMIEEEGLIPNRKREGEVEEETNDVKKSRVE